MKWGVRRFQKEDGSLTAAGKKRYDDCLTDSDKRVSSNSDYKTPRKGLIQKRKDKLTEHYISKGYKPMITQLKSTYKLESTLENYTIVLIKHWLLQSSKLLEYIRSITMR